MLAVNEIYGPVEQGEGKSAGMECVFLRLAGCNLACIWCFVENTKIATPKGSKKIKDIEIGDVVLSANTDKIITPKKVTKVFERQVSRDELVRVLVEGDPGVVNNRVFCTKNHEFFTNRGWVAASDLLPGDELNYVDTIDWYMRNDNPSRRPEAKQRLSASAKIIRALIWDRTRRDILQRDNHRCQQCGSTERLEVHHIIPFRISRSNDHSNLITLCKFCHLQVERAFLHNGKKVVSVTPVTVRQAARFNGNSNIIKVYNLEVEDNHTYFANSFLVHNCDTPYTWNWVGTKFQHPDKYDPKREVTKMQIFTVIESIEQQLGPHKNYNLVVSGGEPMLQQEELADLFEAMKKKKWWIEIETNGTIAPTDKFVKLVDQFNCSPKLSNAGKDNPWKKRFRIEALKKIQKLGKKTTFKFVVDKEKDIKEIVEIIESVGIKADQVWLMPEGKTKEEQIAIQDRVKKLADDNGWHFSPRLHILLHGNKRGV